MDYVNEHLRQTLKWYKCNNLVNDFIENHGGKHENKTD